MLNIRLFEERDLLGVAAVWNEAVAAGEVVYYPITPEYYHKKFERDPNYDPRFAFVAEDEGRIIGFIHGVAKKVFLKNETNESTPGFITCFFVQKAHRGRGVGKALVDRLCAAFKASGKRVCACSGDNPINLDWIIPGTPGHDHNNAPGMDEDCMGHAFLQSLGFADQYREIAMYLELSKYTPWEGLAAKRAELRAQGIETGRYDANLDYDFNGMCDRVGSEYWRQVLSTEIACWKENRPNTDIRFIPNGKVPFGPRPILAATHDKCIVGFTGPVDMQTSGRGWFTGICTDPLFERRGIASVLFNLLMQEFVAEGAKFSTLFTGDTNHAQRVYLRAGFRIARRFVIMKKEI